MEEVNEVKVNFSYSFIHKNMILFCYLSRLEIRFLHYCQAKKNILLDCFVIYVRQRYTKSFTRATVCMLVYWEKWVWALVNTALKKKKKSNSNPRK